MAPKDWTGASAVGLNADGTPDIIHHEEGQILPKQGRGLNPITTDNKAGEVSLMINRSDDKKSPLKESKSENELIPELLTKLYLLIAWFDLFSVMSMDSELKKELNWITHSNKNT